MKPRVSVLLAAVVASLLQGLVPAIGQTLIQSGPWTPGHLPAYYPTGAGSSVPLVIDGGAAGGGATTQGVSEMLMIKPAAPTGPLSTNWCDYDANPTASTSGFHYFCFSPNSGGGGLIAFGAAGGATAIPLNFNVNGSVFQAGVSIAPLVLPSTIVGGVAGGVPYFSSTTVMNASPLLAANALMTGGGAAAPPATVTTGTGVVAAIGNNVNATNGLVTQAGSITANDCLVWGPGVKDAGGGCGNLVVGTTAISGGTSSRIEFNNGGLLGELPTTGSGAVVLATSPTLVTPSLGTPANGVMTNVTGLPISTGVSGLGIGVANALGGNLNASGGVPALNGTPTVGHNLIWSAAGVQDGGAGSSIVVGSTATTSGAAGQIMFDTGAVLTENAGLLYVSPNLLLTSNTAGILMGSAQDANLYRDAAGSLGQRNTANPQVFCAYNTYTSSANYERGCLDWQTTSNTLLIGTEKGASGAARNLELVVGGANELDYGVTSAGAWTAAASIGTTGAFIAKGPHPTAALAGGTCAGAITGGATAGIITLTALCASGNTATLTAMPAAPTGYSCFASDRTQPATLIVETASTPTGVTLTFSGTASGATDVVQYACTGY